MIAVRKKTMTTKAKVAKNLSSIARKVESRLADFFSESETAQSCRFFEAPSERALLPQIRDLTLRGGKRLRAGLLIKAAALFDPEAETKAPFIDAAAAMEIAQTFLLIHDDIMDGDSVRRGGPTVHVALAAYTGDKRLGENLGILAGDLACALEHRLLLGMEVDEERIVRVMDIFAAMHVDVIRGQALDLLGEAPAYEVAVHKTASYTTVGPMAAGAALAGARNRDVEHLARIAEPLGVAFQFRDDLLGTFGDPERIGKPVGRDLLDGKRTVLVEEAFARADRFQKKRLEEILGQKKATSKDIAAAQEIFEQCGAKSACEKHIQDLVEEFMAGMDREYYDEDARAFLKGVAAYMAERDT